MKTKQTCIVPKFQSLHVFINTAVNNVGQFCTDLFTCTVFNTISSLLLFIQLKNIYRSNFHTTTVLSLMLHNKELQKKAKDSGKSSKITDYHAMAFTCDMLRRQLSVQV